jgi:molybdopterin-binding protein
VEKLLAPLEAASILGISYPTLKNWIYRGKLKSTKTFGGHHRVPESEIVRLIPRGSSQPEIETLRGYGSKISERNQLVGLVLEVKYDGLVAQVTLAIGKQRITSIISADGARELQLKPGVYAAALFKSTEVMILRF